MSEALLQQARELHRAGQLAQALVAYRRLTTATPGVAEYWKLQAIAEHQSVLDALSSGDPDKAAAAMAEHVQKVRGRAIADAAAE